MEIWKLFRFSSQMAHVTLLSCLGQSKPMTKPAAMSALHCYPGSRKDSVKVMRTAVSVTVDHRGLRDSWVVTSLEKQHPPFPCQQPWTRQFTTVSCILYEELWDRSTKILNTMEMLISLSKPSHTLYGSRIIALCLTNTCDKKIKLKQEKYIRIISIWSTYNVLDANLYKELTECSGYFFFFLFERRLTQYDPSRVNLVNRECAAVSIQWEVTSGRLWGALTATCWG